MTSIIYVAKINEAGAPDIFRQTLDDDGEVLFERSIELAEASVASTEAVNDYLNLIKSNLQQSIDHLNSVGDNLNDVTYSTLGSSYKSLERFISMFDRNLLPPSV